MKKSLYKNYKKPKIQENKLKTNFFSFNYRDSTGDLLVIEYCGQCSAPPGRCDPDVCSTPIGCDKSC